MKHEDSMGTVYLMKRAELAVRGCVEVALAPFRLTPAQFLVLFLLNRSKGLSSADVARAIGVRPQSIVDLIGPLEREGLIRRWEAPEHRRILRIALSAAGERLLARATSVASEIEKSLLSNLTAPELVHMRQGLMKLLANAEAHETHASAPSLTAPRQRLGRGTAVVVARPEPRKQVNRRKQPMATA